MPEHPTVVVAESMLGETHLEDGIRNVSKIWRIFAVICALLLCLCAGSISTYSLYSLELARSLNMTQLEINAISISGEVGMYASVPILGFLVDRYGPAPLSLISASFFGPAYLVLMEFFPVNANSPLDNNLILDINEKTVSTNSIVIIYMICFAFIGAGTSAMYLSGIVSCAKSFIDSPYTGIAISLPVTFFGTSSLMFAQIISHFFYFNNSNERIVNVRNLFLFYAILSALVGMSGGVFLRIEKDSDLDNDFSIESNYENENTPLLGTNNQHTNTTTEIDQHAKWKAAFYKFIKDPTMWSFGLGLFSFLGSSEMFINNIGSLFAVPSFHVSIFYLCSTVSRIIAGLSCDIASSYNISCLNILLFFGFISFCSNCAIAIFGTNIPCDYLLSTGIGTGYGAMFTFGPLIIGKVWGSDYFGTNWGLLTLFIALGSVVYGIIYGLVFDSHSDGPTCDDISCYRTTFIITSISCASGLVFWFRNSVIWKKKNIDV